MHAHIAGGLRLYYHVFYLFSPQPPFELIGLGHPFTFPSEMGLVQFASGMALSQDQRSVTVAYGEQDCEARAVSLSLDAILADTLAGFRASP